MTGPAQLAGEVARIDLLGAPRTILIDQAALGAEATPVGQQTRELLAALGLQVVPIGTHGPTLTGPTVAVLGHDHPPVAGCYPWYVGPGRAPSWMHPTAGDGPRTTVLILSLLGTSFAQERAGAAFRAAGAGRPLPGRASYDAAAILDGITQAVTSWTASSLSAPASPPVFDDSVRRQLLREALTALDRCCAPNGAIAAAPPSAHVEEPDYWFFWQRDAAHVAFALQALATSGPDQDIRAHARARLEGYLRFIAELGPKLAQHRDGLATSRCTMAGEPVGGYGDPQHDGPAATALTVLTVMEDPRAALKIARPFLDHLLSPEARQPGFDLWELTVGTSFHEINLRRRALLRAAAIATIAGDPAVTRYRARSERLALELNAWRDPLRPGFIHTRGPLPPWFEATTRLDMSIIGSTLLCYDVTDNVLNVDDPDMTATMERLEGHFATRWPSNVAWQHAGHLGGGIGRFPEDCNDGRGSTGGNPWPITTLWAAQYHLRRAQRSAHAGPSHPAEHTQDIADDIDRGLAHLTFLLAHVDPAAISEQIDGTTSQARGARPLAWAHAELVTTLLALPDLT